MTIQARLDIFCTSCEETHRQDIRRLKPGAAIECPYCGGHHVLNPDIPTHATLLKRAVRARQDRKLRLDDLRQGWVTPRRAGLDSFDASEIFDSLDMLSRQLDAVSLR